MNAHFSLVGDGPSTRNNINAVSNEERNAKFVEAIHVQ